MSSDWITTAAFVVFPFIGGFTGALLFTRKSFGWYDTLKGEPAPYRPPKWAFGPAWSTLYACMGYASYLVWQSSGGFLGSGQKALMLYGTSLALNWAWTPIFFGAKNLGAGLVDLTLTWMTVAMTGYEFYKIVPLAGYLFIPYVTWLSLAVSLNYRVWKNNRSYCISFQLS